MPGGGLCVDGLDHRRVYATEREFVQAVDAVVKGLDLTPLHKAYNLHAGHTVARDALAGGTAGLACDAQDVQFRHVCGAELEGSAAGARPFMRTSFLGRSRDSNPPSSLLPLIFSSARSLFLFLSALLCSALLVSSLTARHGRRPLGAAWRRDAADVRAAGVGRPG